MNTVLIAAAAGRALAASARRGGYVPLVADFFGDQDTLALAAGHEHLRAGLERGMDEAELLSALAALARGHAPLGIVCGTGFEDRPHLLARLAERWLLIGNSPRTIAEVKDPLALARVCRDLGIPHPPITVHPPSDPSGWLVKRWGGAGGVHVRPIDGIARSSSSISGRPSHYYQRRVPGDAVSALVLGNGTSGLVLGFSTQWAAPAAERPFRFGGAARPAELAPSIAARLAAAVRRLIAAVPLKGLNSIDFLVDGDDFWLLEINPRPGATLDIFEPPQGSLFAWHVCACAGMLPEHVQIPEAATAIAIVYAENDVAVTPGFDWPQWTADRPMAGTIVRAGDPLCTVFARAATAAEARRLVTERAERILQWTTPKAA